MLLLRTRSGQGPSARVLLGVLALAMSTACRDPEPAVWGVAKGISPFSSLEGLTLPITLGEVLQRRPGSLRRDYGVRESRDRAEIQYKGARPDYHHPAPLDGPVELVTATWEFKNDDTATVKWKEVLHELARRSGSEPMCEVVLGTQYRIRQAQWRIEGGGIVVSQQYHDSVTTDGERLPVRPTVSIIVAPDSAELANDFSFSQPTPCQRNS